MVVVVVAVVGKPVGNTHQPTHIPIPTWVGTDPWWVWVWVGLWVPMGIPMLFPNFPPLTALPCLPTTNELAPIHHIPTYVIIWPQPTLIR